MDKFTALQAVLDDPTRSENEKQIARAALQRNRSSEQVLTPESAAMLHALGKNHLLEISEHAFETYAARFGDAQKVELSRQWSQWVAPTELLNIIRWSEVDYWRSVRSSAETDDVQQHAAQQIERLSKEKA